jgi:hypothetical protein
MQLDEQIELAFKAGVSWAMENAYCRDMTGVSYADVDLDRNIEEGIQEYINGNSKPSKSASILDQSHGGSI